MKESQSSATPPHDLGPPIDHKEPHKKKEWSIIVKSAHLLPPILSDDSNDHREIKRCKFMQCAKWCREEDVLAVGRVRIKGCRLRCSTVAMAMRGWKNVVDKVDRFSASLRTAGRQDISVITYFRSKLLSQMPMTHRRHLPTPVPRFFLFLSTKFSWRYHHLVDLVTTRIYWVCIFSIF